MKAIKNNLNNRKNSGFTIVELLIVIIVIAVLSTIVIVSYRGITAKANEAALTADLTNASKKLAMYYTEYGTYPNDLNAAGCPTGPRLDTDYCIKHDSNTVSEYHLISSSSYTLNYTKGTLSYEVDNDKAPYNTNKTPITAIASISGTPQTSQTLTAGAITPADASVSYQWQSATTAGGAYTNISGATSNTLALNPSNINKYIKVIVTGTGTYSGIQTSAASTQVETDSNWKVIGSQVWATANLNTGTRIAGTVAQVDNATPEKYCYGDTESNCTTYGGLYQWGEAMGYSTTAGAQGLCPAGSHIPSDNDWKILEVALGMTQAQADTTDAYRGTNQGTQLKSGGTSGLNMPLAGYRTNGGSFNDLSSYANLWSSSESSTSAMVRDLNSGLATVARYANIKALGFSVRCLGN